MRTGVCADCQGSEHPIVGRGLCQRCYRRNHHHGTIDQYPRADRRPSGLVAPEVAQAVGVTYRQLDYWLRRGYLTGTPVTTGSGHPRVLTDEQIRLARHLGVLTELGIPAGLAASALHNGGLLAPGISLVFTDPPEDEDVPDAATSLPPLPQADRHRRDGPALES